MAEHNKNYLHSCLGAFRGVMEKKYARPFDLPAIEKSVKRLRRETPLSYSDLTQFESPKHWWFEKFWVFPPENRISSVLKLRKFNFWGLPNRETEVIRALHEVFRSIELVSIILRFIKPESYGIISPPVEKILDVRRGSDATETYLYYLSDLRTIKTHYGFARVADVDMALWVVHEKCYGTSIDNDIVSKYHADEFLLRLRAKNLMGNFFARYSFTEVARALEHVNPQLAAQIGGIAFERMVRGRDHASKPNNDVDKDLRTLIDELREGGTIDMLTAGQWHNARRVRNKAIHGTDEPTGIELKRLLELLI